MAAGSCPAAQFLYGWTGWTCQPVYACGLRWKGVRGWLTEEASRLVGRVPDLVLGPLLRYTDASEATVWVETDVPCEVTVSTGDGGVGLSRTFGVGGHHYALVRMSGLEPGKTYDYEVLLDGALVWPEPGSPFPRAAFAPWGKGNPSSWSSARAASPPPTNRPTPWAPRTTSAASGLTPCTRRQ